MLRFNHFRFLNVASNLLQRNINKEINRNNPIQEDQKKLPFKEAGNNRHMDLTGVTTVIVSAIAAVYGCGGLQF